MKARRIAGEAARAMLGALANGKLRAAGLDVLPEEPMVREEGEMLRSYFRETHKMDTLLADHILMRMRSAIVTRHRAFSTQEAVQRILDTTRGNIAGFIAVEPKNLAIGGEK